MIDPIKLSRDLAEIVLLTDDLRGQAVNDAGAHVDGTSLPGGRAMIALAPVADQATWERQVEVIERAWAATVATADVDGWPAGMSPDDRPDIASDEDDTTEPALQLLRFWSDHYRRITQRDWLHIKTLVTEANYLRTNLEWILNREPHADVFARDVRLARRSLENILAAGERSERGVPCMYDECKGVRLVRKLVPARGPDGEKIYRHSDWHCPRCKRTWDEDAYWRNVGAANERAQREDISGRTWCSIDYASRDVGRPVKTIRTWIDRQELSVVCIILGRRAKYVDLDEVRERHALAEERTKRRTG